MPARHHSRATRLAATFLARLASPEVAATTFRVDVRTVRGWQAGSVELPDDEWTAIRDVLRARGAEMAAKGDVKGLVQTLTAAGISDRNVRYGELIARREARRAGEQGEQEQPDPVRAAVLALSADRQRFLRDALHLEIATRNAAEDPTLNAGADPSPSDDEAEARLLAWIAEVAAMPDEQIAAGSEAVRARLRELQETGERKAARESDPVRPLAVPTAPVAAPEPPRAPLRVVDDAGYPDQWQPWRRYDP